MSTPIVSPVRRNVKSGTLRGRADIVRMPFTQVSHDRPRPANPLTIFDSYPTSDYEYVARVKAAKGEGK